MYRFKDARGLSHTLTDEGELRAAIREGRVGPGTPLAEGEDGRWTVARLHPSFQSAVEGRSGASEKSLWEMRGMELLRSRKGQIFLVIFTVLMSNALRAGMRPPLDAEERETYTRALIALSGGDMSAAATVEQPPRSRPLRPVWAMIMGTQDVLAHMQATEERLGLGSDPPASWMSDWHIRYPTSHPEIVHHWEAMGAFHALYRDSVITIAERAVRARAAQADAAGQLLEEALEAMRIHMHTTIEIHGTAIMAANAALGLHNYLVRQAGRIQIGRNGDLVFDNPYAAESWERQSDRLDEFLARIDSLGAVSSARVQADLARLIR